MTRVLNRVCVGAMLAAAMLASSAAPALAKADGTGADGGIQRSVVNYAVPGVRLVREDGSTVRLDGEVNDGRPVVLAFIFTTCTSVCPLISHTLAEVQSRLGDQRDRVHLMSISIDPEQDTPARLREYARALHAGPEWQHYTGSLEASEAAQRAFNVYRGQKMEHAPAVLVRPRVDAPWVRLEGFATAQQVLAELPTLDVRH